jgi:hypothetical protein
MAAGRNSKPTATFMDVPAADHDDELLTRQRAAAFLSSLWGDIRVTPRSLASWPVPYRKLGHHALYRRSDLLTFAHRKLQNTPVRTGGGVAAIQRDGGQR